MNKIQCTGNYVIVAINDDDTRFGTSYCRINHVTENNGLTVDTQLLCPVKRISRAKIFDTHKNAMFWKEQIQKHSPVLKHCELYVKELLI